MCSLGRPDRSLVAGKSRVLVNFRLALVACMATIVYITACMTPLCPRVFFRRPVC